MTAHLVDAALAYAGAGWTVLPLRGKVPLCAHGFHDASSDPETIRAWWARRPEPDIGGAIPAAFVVLDIDPRNGGTETLAALEAAHGALPETLTSLTGGGGRHLYFAAPSVVVDLSTLGTGIDVKRPGRGYVVLPPSVHPETGRKYRWLDTTMPAAPLPNWITERLRRPTEPTVTRRRPRVCDGARPGDRLNESATWAEILEPHGWRVCRVHGDVTYWTRPGKQCGVSASTNAVGTDHLHVFSSAAGQLEGDTSYSKFGAFAALNHSGDHIAAARALREAS